MEQRDRLKQWIENLDSDKIIEIALDCIEELILTESVCFYDQNKVPYWDASGDRLDGSNSDDE